MDYVMGSREAADMVSHFTVPPCPIGADHTYLSLTFRSLLEIHPPIIQPPRTIFHFTQDLAEVYDYHVHDQLFALDPSAPMAMLTSQLSHVLHSAAVRSFPYHIQTGRPPTSGSMPQNRWYDDECRNLYHSLRVQRARGEITRRQAGRRMHTLTRRKRRAYEEAQYWDTYHMLMSRDAAAAWRRLREPRPPTPIADPQTR